MIHQGVATDVHCYVVFGLGSGDEGKGHTVARLTRHHDARLIVRFNGGPQVSHHVVVDGRTHTVCQFGSSMALSREAKTFLSRQTAVDPERLLAEAGCTFATASIDRSIGSPSTPVAWS